MAHVNLASEDFLLSDLLTIVLCMIAVFPTIYLCRGKSLVFVFLGNA